MSDNKFANLPEAIRTYTENLTTPAKSGGKTPSMAQTMEAKAVADYAFNGLTATDLAYDTTQYPVSGTFSATTPPWINDLTLVPTDWQWTTTDTTNMTARSGKPAENGQPAVPGDVGNETAYIKANVPGQTYTGTTTAEIIQQWYTQGFWDTTIFPQAQIDTLTQNWINDDAEFARQRLGGANPNVIKAAGASDYDISTWIKAASNSADLDTLSKTLTKAQTNNELMVCDYTGVLANVISKQFVQNGFYFAAPICFFTIDTSNNTLVPQAIQIQAEDSSSYIFTPGDSKDPNGDAWLLAKLWTASADEQWWYSGSHLFNTHSIDMLFGTGVLNTIQNGDIDVTHPMVILAKPYLNKSFNINNAVISAPANLQSGIYQKSITTTENFVDAVLPTGRIGLYQIINNLYQNYNFDDNALPTQMSNRGLGSGAMAKVSFPYRDDGQVWWTAIQNFVGGIVDATYPNGDSDVKADKGLNTWLTTVQNAFNKDGVTRFTWTGNETADYLKSVFTNLLYTSSAQHTGVNDTMFPGWAFTPNGAFAMQAAPPTDAASVTQQIVLDSLPNPQTSSQLTDVITNQIVFVMNGTPVVSESLAVSSTQSDIYTTYPYDQSTQAAQYKAVGNFWDAIWSASSSVKSQISTNQANRVKAWKGSTPVPNSVAYYYLSAELVSGSYSTPEYLNAPAMNAIQV